MLSPGDRVKDYEVIAPLRAGGMAMLYLARKRGVGGFSRMVALKLLHAHLLDDEAVSRLFLDEARISANVAHPNVVSVEEIGRIGSSYFIAMEYVHGVSLAELLASLAGRRLRMSPKLCVSLAAQMAEALHAVHEATSETGDPLHIVHRDVSPQNVLIGHTGHVKLIDFGIAKSQPTGQHVGGRRAVLGKLGYMAPEQLRLEPADRQSDVYALGVMLWEMLTSRSLFRSKRIDDERDWATRESPPPPSKYSPIALPALDRVVQKALAFEASQRFESALELRSALLRAVPAAVQVDAPMVATLMRSMLGDELERRRADLPSEVSVQLDLAADTGSASISVDELTADMGEDPVSQVSESRHRHTAAHSPAALRRSTPGDTSARLAIAPALPPPVRAETSAAESEAQIVTVQAAALQVELPSAVSLAARTWMWRATCIGIACLAVGIVVGATVTGRMPAAATAQLSALLRRPIAATMRPARLAEDVTLTARVAAMHTALDGGRSQDAGTYAHGLRSVRRVDEASDERPRVRRSAAVAPAGKRAPTSRHATRATRSKSRRRAH